MHTKSQQQASRRDCEEQEQRHQVIAKLLAGDCPSVFETPMQGQHHSNDHQDRRQVQEVEEHMAHPGELSVKRPYVYAEHEYLVHLWGVRLTLEMDPTKDQRKSHCSGEYRAPGHAEMRQPAAPAPPANEVLRHEVANQSPNQSQHMAPDFLAPEEQLPATAPVDTRRRTLQPYGIAVGNGESRKHRPKGIDQQGGVIVAQVARAEQDTTA